MATYRIRHLHCVICDAPRRAKSKLVNGEEQSVNCFQCQNGLINIGTMDFDPGPSLDKQFLLMEKMKNLFRYPNEDGNYEY